MVPTAIILLDIVLDVLAWRRLNASFDRLDEVADRIRSFKV
jgi:HAMP domain-containing protein